MAYHSLRILTDVYTRKLSAFDSPTTPFVFILSHPQVHVFAILTKQLSHTVPDSFAIPVLRRASNKFLLSF